MKQTIYPRLAWHGVAKNKQIYLPFLGQIMGVIDVSEGGFMEGFPSITPIQPLKEEGRAETIPDEVVQVQQKEGFSAFLFPDGGPE